MALANGAAADPLGLSDLRSGDMRKLTVHAQALPGSDAPFLGEDGRERTLADYAGQVVVLNFWATWCAPCKKEMPHLDALQGQMGGETFQVVTVATGRNPAPAIDAFFEDTEVEHLPKHTDASQSFARSLGVLALPVTLVLDAQGREVARLQGEADWSSDSAIAILETVIGAVDS